MGHHPDQDQNFAPGSAMPVGEAANLDEIWSDLSRSMRDREAQMPRITRADAQTRDKRIGFAEGTRLITDKGRLAVEFLHPGDLIRTLDSGMQELRWIGRHDVTFGPSNADDRPVILRRDAMNMDVPSEDIRVAPQHRVLLSDWRAQLFFCKEEVMVEAAHLVDDAWVERDTACTSVSYYFLGFDEFEVVETSANTNLSVVQDGGLDARDTYLEFVRGQKFRRSMIDASEASVLRGVPRIKRPCQATQA